MLLPNFTWWHDAIRLHLPNTFYSVTLFYDGERKLTSYYGNLEAPFVRTPIGVDTRDYALDIVATPEGKWWWKDEAEFARRLEVGVDSAAHQVRVRAAGEELVRCLEQGAFPFNREWQLQIPKNLPIPKLSVNWSQDYATHDLLSAYAA